MKQIGSWQFHGITSTADSHKNIITSDSTFDFAWNFWFAAFAILKEGICGLSILLRPMFKSEMPHWLVPLVSEMLHFIQFPLQTFKHVLLGCDQNMHIVAQTCTISHKIAQSGTKK